MNTINNCLKKYVVIIFAIVTFVTMVLRVPFWDETHAFDIACLKISEILYLTRIEGHTFLWYFILKPFTSFNLYPWSMFIINWLFCMGAIIILWKKAPFSPMIKTLIIFSVPFLFYFAPVARCYSIGVLLLFLICAYYPLRFKKPYLFTGLIVLCANTSLMAMIGAFYIGLLFLYEIYHRYKKNLFQRKKIKNILIAFSIASIIIILQFVGLRNTGKVDTHRILTEILYFVIFPYASNILPFLLRLFSSIMFYFLTFYLFKRCPKAFFFISSIFLTLTFLFTKFYLGSHWNHYFYFVYFIILFWIFAKVLLKNKFIKILFTLILIFFMLPNAVHDTEKMDLIYSSKSKKIAKVILDNPQYRNSKLYTLEWWSDIYPGASVYLAREGVTIYDMYNQDRRSFEGMKILFDLKEKLIDFDEFYRNMDKNSYLLSAGMLFRQKFVNLLVTPKENGDLVFKTIKKTYLLKRIEYKKEDGIIVYKISEI